MALQRLLGRVITLWALLGGLILLAIVIMTAVNVAGFTGNTIARPFGGTVPGLPGYEDAVTMLIGVAGLSMFPYCQLNGGHASVDVFMSKAPKWANRFVMGLSNILVACVALAMAVMLVYGTLEARSDGVQTAVLGWPVWVFMPTAVVSCILWSVAALLPNPTEPEV